MNSSEVYLFETYIYSRFNYRLRYLTEYKKNIERIWKGCQKITDFLRDIISLRKKLMFKKFTKRSIIKMKVGNLLYTLHVFLRVEKRCMFACGYLHLDCKYGERVWHSATRFTPFESFLPRLPRRDTYRSGSVYLAARINNTAYFHPYPSDFTSSTRRRIVWQRLNLIPSTSTPVSTHAHRCHANAI